MGRAKNKALTVGVVAVLVGAYSGVTAAAVSADEAKQLGSTLTAMGAEKAGNKDGSIPAYTGEGVKAPPSFDPNIGHRRSPFSDEKPLFSITPQNADQYASRFRRSG